RPAPDAPPAPAPADAAPPPAGVAVTLEIHSMDIWAQYLPAGATVQVTLGGSALAGVGAFPVRRVVIDRAGEVRVRVEAADHEPLEAVLRIDGGMPRLVAAP